MSRPTNNDPHPESITKFPWEFLPDINNINMVNVINNILDENKYYFEYRKIGPNQYEWVWGNK